ncbi:MBL fold metallo-hydrolase RNA specificity domain-containing protein [Pelodictyon luteolum]|uniref:Metallo-beta-lactamase superfamily protein n=1 Tax=Chlorobium luteolum (strain DSM 273 / BCRC 81028 / 2530) TaxID=319225 RepID=Q3B5B0_CHLL3|nr:MBL fold metallo-hydrolase [Pelodictyon luteolum]ABB23471.1 metallo-beta-lactamase superfamily protein [Pelodictyon luteolum DSM 273]
MEIEFYGATERVTGSCHILRVGRFTVLLDCGLIQGSDVEEALNRAPFAFDPERVEAMILSHGHIDHSGRIPLLVKRGFTGPVFTGDATADLARVLLLDSASLAERDALDRRKHPRTAADRHAEPLYTRDDAVRALNSFKPVPYGRRFPVVPGLEACFRDAGHILGSAVVELWLTEGGVSRKLVFSGDLGQYGSPILNDPEAVTDADALIIESTYGDRLHRDYDQTLQELGEIFNSASRGSGNILIPAFSIGRSQELLYLFARHYEEWGMQHWQVYLDSPMAIEASMIYLGYPELFDREALASRNDKRLLPTLKNLHFTPKVEQSQAINKERSGAIIIAGSGMCNGGRILHHLKHNISRPECHLLITGYQAEGTLGRQIVEGAAEVEIHGRHYPVAAAVHTVGGLSAHGDREDMLRWVSGFKSSPRVFVVHGDPAAKEAFRNSIEERLQLTASIPRPGERYDFSS